jgi:DNA-binding transcriptional MerR regulator
MNIKKFSEISGISAYTLRYYEKIGIFQEVMRNSSGHRDFTEKDLLWAEFIENRGQTLINPETLTDKSGLPRTSFEINIR